MKIIDGGITSPKGFKATGNHVGVKKEKKDLCLIASEIAASAAGCFTTNTVKAAPVLWDIKICEKKGKIRGIVTNSGNANACTAEQGMTDCEAMAAAFAKELGASKEEILVCSTGVIGVPLPIEKITKGISATAPMLGSSRSDATNAVQAIMTTDTYEKEIAVEIEIGDKTVTLAGIAKGSGMIHPNMATLLGYITTDAEISSELLGKALKECVYKTFNMVSVDGDTSTNDTTLIMANGMAENPEIKAGTADYDTFFEALGFVCEKLAKDIARDGEGATKLIEVTVTNAATYDDASKLAKSVISSSLLKAAMFGADANFGRVLCAMGYSGAKFEQTGVTIEFKNGGDVLTVMKAGVPVQFDEDFAKKLLSRDNVFIDITLSDGKASAKAWGCDLTYDYVKINGDYRS